MSEEVKQMRARAHARARARRSGFTRVSSKNQVTLPVDALREAGIKSGDVLRAEVRTTGEVVLVREDDPLVLYAGVFHGLYPSGSLEDIRDEWER